MNEYTQGDKVRLSAAFTDNGGSAIDPDAVYLEVLPPGSILVTYEYGGSPGITKDSTGNYHVDVSVSLAGQWYYCWYSTGTGQAAEQDTFAVAAKKTS